MIKMRNFVDMVLYIVLWPQATLNRSFRVGSGAWGRFTLGDTIPRLREGIKIHGKNLFDIVKDKVGFLVLCMTLSIIAPTDPALCSLPGCSAVFEI